MSSIASGMIATPIPSIKVSIIVFNDIKITHTTENMVNFVLNIFRNRFVNAKTIMMIVNIPPIVILIFSSVVSNTGLVLLIAHVIIRMIDTNNNI